MPHEGTKSQLTPERWQRIREVFAEIIEIPERERSAFFSIACAEDPELHLQVEDLLRAHEASEAGYLDRPSHIDVCLAQTGPVRESIVGRQIGAYRIENEIARG